MNALRQTALCTGATAFVVAAAFASGIATPARAADKSMIIDGIMATLTTRDGADVVVLDTVQGANRQLREQQAEDAATDLSGCRAKAVTGSAYDGQGADARPVLVQVDLKC